MISKLFADKLTSVKSKGRYVTDILMKTHMEGHIRIDEEAGKRMSDKRAYMVAAEKLVNEGLVEVVSIDGVLYCCAKLSQYDCEDCEDCENMKVKKVDLNGKTYKRKICKNKMCVHYKDLMGAGAVKLIKSISTKVNYTIGKKKNNVKSKVNAKTMVDLFNTLWKKYYKNDETTNNKAVMLDAMLTLVTLFKTKIGSRYKEIVPLYIEDCFKMARKDNEVVRINVLALPENVRTYINKKVQKKKVRRAKNIGLCVIHNIQCPYWLGAKCELEEQGVKCDNKIREAMRKRYGEETV